MSQISKLLGKSAQELFDMSDADLIAYLTPSFIFTRPEKQLVNHKTAKSSYTKSSGTNTPSKVSKNALLAEALEMAEKFKLQQQQQNKIK